MFGGDDGLPLCPEHFEKTGDTEAVPNRRERHQVFFRQPEQTRRRIHSPPVLRVGRARMLFLQMDKTAGRLDKALEVICVLRFRLQPELLKHVVRLVITLLIPATKKTEVAGMPGDFVGRFISRETAQPFHQPGNSLAFVHGTLSFGSAEMTGNRAPIVFPRRADVRTAAGDG